ncbi:hypothetical protein IL306_007545 [Fusarium sp. DS 682]|nr:hypothetical protein IL306_007545 [Fusarium sp. DS 682]
MTFQPDNALHTLGRGSNHAATNWKLFSNIPFSCILGLLPFVLAAILLSRRYRRIGTVADLKKAIHVGRKACKLTPDDDTQAKHFSSLAIMLKHEYFRTDDPNDLEEAIRVQREAVRTAHKNHPDSVATFHNLAALLTKKYKITDKMEHLEEALQLGRQIVYQTPKDHPNRAAYLNTLAVQFSDMSRKTGLDNHVQEAILCGKEALDATEDGHPERANRLVNQGGRYSDLFWKTEEQGHLNSAIVLLESALYSPSTYGVPLQVYGLSSGAAAVSLSANKGPLAALSFLEQGRGMLASSVEETRIEALHLRTEHPALAERFTQLRSRVESLSLAADSTNLSNTTGLISSTHQLEAGREAKELDKLLSEIRQKPGFEDFLTAPSETSIKDAALSGPIVVINVSDFRRDAIIVERDQIRNIPLPRLTIQDIRSNTQQIHRSSPKILEWLWDTIAEPVLDALGIRKAATEERLPRIWWIPTGVLSIYPLHAAGRHNRDSTETVIDRTMSSYSSSIKAIIRSRSRAGLDAIQSGTERALLVSIERTPGYSSLPSADREITLLRPTCKTKGFEVVEPKSFKNDIVSQLPRCKVFHFAGHGSTNLRDPSQSSLMLEDWQKDPLTVSTLFDIDIQQYSPFLAYLSACGTGQIAHEKFLDESIHLISAFQLAGFRHVIGTLWEVGDDISVNMARITYESIQRGDLADESVCRGLRKATLDLRDQWFQEQNRASSRKRKARSISEGETEMSEGARDVVAMDEEDDASKLPLWVPYVHFGV